MGDRRNTADFLGELGIGDQEGRGSISNGNLKSENILVEKVDELVDFGIHDGFSNQGHGTVFQGHGFGNTVFVNSLAPSELFD